MLETNRKEQFLTKGTALKRCYRKEKRLMANLNTRQKNCFVRYLEFFRQILGGAKFFLI